MRTILFFLSFFTMFSLSAQVSKVELTKNWVFRQKGESQWLKADVPGTVHTDLLLNKKIEDPFFRTNEKDLQWIENVDWEYETEFIADENLLSLNNIEIVFEGLDTYADVYLNGNKIIAADNMFLLWKSDVKKHLKDGRNTISIIFSSPVNKVKPKYNNLGYIVPVSNNDQADKKVSVYTRKAGYHYGWDWGPRFVSSGIWRPAYLLAWNDLIIEDLFIKQLNLSGSKASLDVQITASSNSEGIKTVSVYLDDSKTPVLSKDLMFFTGENNLSSRFELDNVELWWPNGMGEQKLYHFKAVISSQGNVLDSKEVRRGFRTIEHITESDTHGKSMYFKVNGKAVFMKGANYIPQDNFLPRVTEERYEHLINTAVSSNMNMIRVWGGGIYENDIFYDLCDEQGILVWQDFMFACALIPPFQDLLINIKKEADYNVKRLRNHASIALWCGNNEVPSFINSNYWGALKGESLSSEDSTTLWNTYDQIFHSILPSAVKAYDDGKYYWSASPSNENYSSKYQPNLKVGDLHYWKVWQGRLPFEKFNEMVGRFMSEYGFQSFPEFETVKSYTIPDDYDINSEVMTAHQRSGIGNQTIKHFMEDMYNISPEFENFLYGGQLVQAEGMKIAIEAHRRAKPYCMGTLYWQLNDVWPVASWSGMDYYGRWKAMQYMIKHAFNDYLISAVKEQDSINIYAISDIYETVNAKVQISLIDFNGKVLKKEVRELQLPENSSLKIFAFNETDWAPGDIKNNSLLNMKLFINGAEVSQNNYFFSKPKYVNFPKVKVKIRQFDDSTIELSADKFAKSVWLFLSGTDNAFSDNYFDLLPGEKKLIGVKTKDLRGAIKTIRIKTLMDAS
jgi:beta-mannosidase